MKRFTKYLISVLITTFILIVALSTNKIYPFGNYELAKFDAYFQYKPFLFYFITLIKTGSLSSYSFIGALGTPIIFLIIYYLLSPFNLIALLFNNPDSMFLSVIVIKTIFANIFANYYFSKKTNNSLFSIIGSLLYTFSGWYLAYYYSNMWLDAFLIFPLFQLGLENLIEKNKYLLFILSLSYIMYTNFYIAFNICLYTLVYYFFKRILKKEKYIDKIKNFDLIFFSTIVTCLISSLIIYVTYSTFLKMGIFIDHPHDLQLSVSLPDLLKSLLSGVTNVVLINSEKNLPNISSSIIVTISLFYFFINKKINKKEKIRNIIYIILIIILLESDYLNFILNCFHAPVGFSYRYSFIITLYLLNIFRRNFETFENKFDKKILIINIALVLLSIYEYKFNNLSGELLTVNICMIICYSIYMLLYANNNYYKYLFLLLVIIELTVTTSINFRPYLKSTIETKEYKEYTYRTDNKRPLEYKYHQNMNYYTFDSGISNFSSMQYGSSIKMLHTLGCFTDDKAYIATCNNTEVFNMLFNIKNQYYLEKIYATKYNPLLELEDEDNNFYNLQSKIVDYLTGQKDVLEKEELQTNIVNNQYQYIIKKERKYYIEITDNVKKIQLNNNYYYQGHEEDEYSLDQVRQLSRTLKPGDLLIIEYYDANKANEQKIYSLNQDKMDAAYQYLKNNQIKYSKYGYSHMEGTITVDDNEIIFTTIPYDESWIVKIDGQEVKPFEALGSLLAIKTSKGTHTISLEYKNNYTIPIVISISSLILTLSFYFIQKKKKH